MNNNLKLFKIQKLFGQMDVALPLDAKVNIFLGENGMGKTTILNCLYYTLSGNLERLNFIMFDSLSLVFRDGTEISIDHVDISAYYEDNMYENHFRRHRLRLESIFSQKELDKIKILAENNFEDDETFINYCYQITELCGHFPKSFIKREMTYYAMYGKGYGRKGDAQKVIEFKKRMSEKIKYEIIYYPTYRRIEEDISSLGIEDDKGQIKNELIKFGMKDVKKSLDELLNTIRSAAINGFTKMTGVLLKQYVEGNISSNKLIEIDKDKLSIALDRIGKQIESEDKEKIKSLVANSDIYKAENSYLLNLINNLIVSYEKQNLLDERIRGFVSICNGYLNGKQYIYDESNVEVKIYNDISHTPINIQNLSSGEKQVISVFSKLYIEDVKDCIILFDEPELSLSIQWQSKFLPDIMKSGKCVNLIAVTHSPFIFDNEFDMLAKNMGNYITNSEQE